MLSARCRALISVRGYTIRATDLASCRFEAAGGGVPCIRPIARTALHVRAAAAWAVLALAVASSGCSSLFGEGAATVAGVTGTAVASRVTRNATVASGIGLGILAGAQAGVKVVERNYHGDQQNNIASVAGGLAIGQVATSESRHAIQLEPNEAGRVTVSRLIGAKELSCKEIVFSVDAVRDKATRSAFYVATICRDVVGWRWATAEPATALWGSLQ